ncbi:MAG: alpha/beta hydrolase-fold protein [Candidatus Heimdallarchaeota archaeon]
MSIRDRVLKFFILGFFLLFPFGIRVQIITSSDEIELNSLDVNGETQYYNLYMPSNPIGAVLIIPTLTGDHNELLAEAMESPIIIAAKKFRLALVFAQGVVGNWYSPDNGEKKVLACLNDANKTLNIPNHSWFIFGFSMGGTGAITISLRHPDVFAGLYVGDGLVWGQIQTPYWWDSQEFLGLDPLNHLEFFRNKSLFLASGTNNGTYFQTNIAPTDEFSQALNASGIRHFYYRGNEPHSLLLLYNSLNLTFSMFSNHIYGTLDQFYEDGWMATPSSTVQPTTAPTTTPAWTIFILLITLILLLVRKKMH